MDISDHDSCDMFSALNLVPRDQFFHFVVHFSSFLYKICFKLSHHEASGSTSPSFCFEPEFFFVVSLFSTQSPMKLCNTDTE